MGDNFGEKVGEQETASAWTVQLDSGSDSLCYLIINRQKES